MMDQLSGVFLVVRSDKGYLIELTFSSPASVRLM